MNKITQLMLMYVLNSILKAAENDDNLARKRTVIYSILGLGVLLTIWILIFTFYIAAE